MTVLNAELAAIVRVLTAAGRWHEKTHQQLFVELQQVDPELATALVRAFGDCSIGLRWLVEKPLGGEEPPCDQLLNGKREEVLDQLTRIDYGVYF